MSPRGSTHRRAIVPAVGLLLFALLSGCVAPRAARLTAPPHAAQGPGRETRDAITVMSYNVRMLMPTDRSSELWLERRGNIVDLIRRQSADIVALQEVANLHSGSRSEQLSFLREELPEYGTASAEEAGLLSALPMFYDPSRFLLLEEGFLHFTESGRPEETAAWGAYMPRFASWALFEELGAPRRLRVINLHLDNLSGLARRESSRIVVRFLREESGEEEGVIVLGDFNAFRSSRTVRTLLDGGLRHALGPSATGSYHFFSGITLWPRIDHILVNDRLEPVDAWMIYDRYEEGYPSDHFPIAAELRWR